MSPGFWPGEQVLAWLLRGLAPILLTILTAAAFLHWKRGNGWPFGVLALAAFWGFLAFAAFWALIAATPGQYAPAKGPLLRGVIGVLVFLNQWSLPLGELLALAAAVGLIVRSLRRPGPHQIAVAIRPPQAAGGSI